MYKRQVYSSRPCRDDELSRVAAELGRAAAQLSRVDGEPSCTNGGSVAPTESPIALPPSLATLVSWVRAPCGDAHLSALRHRVGTIAAVLLCSCGDESERQLP